MLYLNCARDMEPKRPGHNPLADGAAIGSKVHPSGGPTATGLVSGKTDP